ncbi:hypothetical protein [Rosistilla oblonga]|uniref:hypothetical protein n=1 Tax=Rosistilla oblonga TaxID=2527990 RepID=UPI0011A595A5|nr:hypothetical protein [Rosistilla oblonga]
MQRQLGANPRFKWNYQRARDSNRFAKEPRAFTQQQISSTENRNVTSVGPQPGGQPSSDDFFGEEERA